MEVFRLLISANPRIVVIRHGSSDPERNPRSGCLVVTLCIWLSLWSASCTGFRSGSSVSPADSSVDKNAARALSDLVADDLIKDRRDDLRAKLEKTLRNAASDNEFDSAVSQIVEAYGKPVEFEFKQEELGSKIYADGSTKPMRKFWYAATTRKYAKGTYFLIVEVVSDGSGLATGSFSIVNFTQEVPSSLR